MKTIIIKPKKSTEQKYPYLARLEYEGGGVLYAILNKDKTGMVIRVEQDKYTTISDKVGAIIDNTWDTSKFVPCNESIQIFN